MTTPETCVWGLVGRLAGGYEYETSCREKQTVMKVWSSREAQDGYCARCGRPIEIKEEGA